MNKNPPALFHGFPVNTDIPLSDGDTLESLEKEPLLRIDKNIYSTSGLIERIRYVVSQNLCRSINFTPGSQIFYLSKDGDIGINKNAYTAGRPPLYVILNNGVTELNGCTPVKEMEFNGVKH